MAHAAAATSAPITFLPISWLMMAEVERVCETSRRSEEEAQAMRDVAGRTAFITGGGGGVGLGMAQAFLAALDRAVAFGRWRAADVRSILAAGGGTSDPRPAGDALILELPVVPVRSLADYAISPARGART